MADKTSSDGSRDRMFGGDLTREKILAMLDSARQEISAIPTGDSSKAKEANSAAIERVHGMVLEILCDAGMSVNSDTSFLARCLLTLALTRDASLRANLAENFRQTYCAVVQERATHDCRLGADAIVHLMRAQ